MPEFAATTNLNDELWPYTYDVVTKEEAARQHAWAHDVKPDERIWVGELRYPPIHEFIDIHDVLSSTFDRILESAGDIGESYCRFSVDEIVPLDKSFKQWLEANMPPINFYLVGETECFLVKKSWFEGEE